MAVHLFTPTPPITRAVFWDGSNFQEVADVAVNGGRPLVENQDGTITSGGGYVPAVEIPINTWVTEGGMPLDVNYQEVVSEDVEYEVS